MLPGDLVIENGAAVFFSYMINKVTNDLVIY